MKSPTQTPSQIRSAGPLVAIIVPQGDLFYLHRMLGGYLNSLPDHLSKVIVVDDGTVPETSAWLRDQAHPRLDVLGIEAGQGITQAIGAGIAHADAAYHPEWLLISDSRSCPAPGALAAFHGRDRSGADIVVSAGYTHGGHICADTQPRMNPLRRPGAYKRMAFSGGKRGLARAVLGLRAAGAIVSPVCYEKKISLPVVTAPLCGAFLRRGVIGTQQDHLRLDADGLRGVSWARKARRKGARMVFAPEIRFTHIGADLGGIRDLLGGWVPRPPARLRRLLRV